MKDIPLENLPLDLDTCEIDQFIIGVPVLTLIIKGGRVLAIDLAFDNRRVNDAE